MGDEKRFAAFSTKGGVLCTVRASPDVDDLLLEMRGASFHHSIRSPRLTNPFASTAGPGVLDVDLILEPGTIVGLVGPNGAGKTTLLRMLAGLLPLETGEILIEGEQVGASARPGWAKQIVGFMPEEVHWYGAHSARHVIDRLSMLRNDSAELTNPLLEKVGLHSRADHSLNSLSQGMRQRLSLACALLGGPRILLLDEPMNGLDPVAREAFRGVLQQLAADGASILISSHQLAELDRIVDHIVLMHEGRLLRHGPLNQIRENLGLHGGLRVEGTWAESAIKSHFSGPQITETKVEYEKLGSGWVVNIDAPSSGWKQGQRESLLGSMIDAGMTPSAFTTRRVDLVDILSAATGLRPEDVGMGIAADFSGGEEE